MLRLFLLLVELALLVARVIERQRRLEEARTEVMRDALLIARRAAARASDAAARLDNSPDSLRRDPDNRLGAGGA